MDLVTEAQARRRMRELAQGARRVLALHRNVTWREAAHAIERRLGLAVKEMRLPHDEGLYVRAWGSEPALILVDATSGGRERLLFTLLHELCHHLIQTDRALLSFVEEHCPSEEDTKRTKDTLCNIGAAEMLIPAERVRQAIAERGFSISLVPELERQYPASKPAIAAQLADCATHQCVVVVCEFGVRPARRALDNDLGVSDPDAQPELYVVHAWSSRSFKYTVRRYTVVRTDHLLAQVYRTHRITRDLAPIPFATNTRWIVECEAILYKGRVYAVFSATRPVSARQPRLFTDGAVRV